VNEIPILGMGTWNIQGRGGNVTEIIASAMQSGYRHFDCAFRYGNQKLIGPGIKEGLRRTGLSRTDLWITSKLWGDRYVSRCQVCLPNMSDTSNIRHDKPDVGIKETLGQLELDYLDLFLIHWPVGESNGKKSFDHVEVYSYDLAAILTNQTADLETHGEASRPQAYPLHRRLEL